MLHLSDGKITIMEAERREFSVIICAYTDQRWMELQAAVESIRAQAVQSKEIIVVVDHNSALFDRVKNNFRDVIAVENREPAGLSGARNSGILAANGNTLAFLDDDAIAAPDWLEQLGATYGRPDVLGVGGPIKPLWSTGRPRWFPTEFDWVVGCTYRGTPRAMAPVRNLIGANMSFRREVFEAIGGFRNGMGRVGTFPAGCEETELCIRARQHWPQMVMLYNPKVRVTHRVPPGRTRARYFYSRCYAEGLSKAAVSRLVGAKDGLASERTYVLKTLPRGVMAGVTDTLVRRDPTGLARAGAIVSGLAFTTAGYLMGTLSEAVTNLKRMLKEHVGLRQKKPLS